MSFHKETLHPTGFLSPYTCLAIISLMTASYFFSTGTFSPVRAERMAWKFSFSPSKAKKLLGRVLVVESGIVKVMSQPRINPPTK